MPTDSRDGATARPWRCDPEPYDIYVWGTNDEMICEMRGTGAGLDKRANAELIVTAVNDHSALVEKMRALRAEWLKRREAYADCEEYDGDNHGDSQGRGIFETLGSCADELLRALGDGR